MHRRARGPCHHPGRRLVRLPRRRRRRLFGRREGRPARGAPGRPGCPRGGECAGGPRDGRGRPCPIRRGPGRFDHGDRRTGWRLGGQARRPDLRRGRERVRHRGAPGHLGRRPRREQDLERRGCPRDAPRRGVGTRGRRNPPGRPPRAHDPHRRGDRGRPRTRASGPSDRGRRADPCRWRRWGRSEWGRTPGRRGRCDRDRVRCRRSIVVHAGTRCGGIPVADRHDPAHVDRPEPARPPRGDQGIDRRGPRPTRARRRPAGRHPARVVAAGGRRCRGRSDARGRLRDARQEHDRGLARPRADGRWSGSVRVRRGAAAGRGSRAGPRPRHDGGGARRSWSRPTSTPATSTRTGRT